MIYADQNKAPSFFFLILKSYTWSSTKVIQTQRHENGIWKVSHEMELIEGEWQTRMRTKNIIGWSKFSAPFSFKIDDKGALKL